MKEHNFSRCDSMRAGSPRLMDWRCTRVLPALSDAVRV
jgi:hypothetical protein